jgi:hypothetical protein
MVHIHSLGTGALACAEVTGYITPNMQSLGIVHDAQIDRIRGVNGKVTGVMGVDDVIECTFEMIPEGSSVANALEAASLPAAPAAFTTTGLQVIECGGIADALNAGSGNPWVYEGGGRINAAADGKWTMTVTCRRYSGITSSTIVTG